MMKKTKTVSNLKQVESKILYDGFITKDELRKMYKNIHSPIYKLRKKGMDIVDCGNHFGWKRFKSNFVIVPGQIKSNKRGFRLLLFVLILAVITIFFIIF